MVPRKPWHNMGGSIVITGRAKDTIVLTSGGGWGGPSLQSRQCHIDGGPGAVRQLPAPWGPLYLPSRLEAVQLAQLSAREHPSRPACLSSQRILSPSRWKTWCRRHPSSSEPCRLSSETCCAAVDQGLLTSSLPARLLRSPGPPFSDARRPTAVPRHAAAAARFCVLLGHRVLGALIVPDREALESSTSSSDTAGSKDGAHIPAHTSACVFLHPAPGAPRLHAIG